jgi:LigD-like primase-polymerase
MPADSRILAYYDAIAPKILPFLRGRSVAVRHHFETGIVFRRHREVGGKKTWITIATKQELLEIVRQHGYEFFPHLEGEHDLWFALDIDMRDIPLPLGKTVVRTAARILEERRVKYLLSFSGGNGFHVRWAFARRDVPRKTWEFLRGIVRSVREETEKRLQASRERAAFYRHLPKTDPITERNSMDRAAQTSVLFDELILRPAATIRAPFSLHLKHRFAAVPISPAALRTFRPARHATQAAAIRMRPVRLPTNPVSLFQKPPWTS